MTRNDILLNRKVLSELAVWEPRTFEALSKIGRERAVVDGLNGVEAKALDNGIITRGMLKLK